MDHHGSSAVGIEVATEDRPVDGPIWITHDDLYARSVVAKAVAAATASGCQYAGQFSDDTRAVQQRLAPSERTLIGTSTRPAA